MKNWIINKLGGYPTISDAINAIRDQKYKHQILTLAVRKLFYTISDEDMLREENGTWFYKGKALNEADKQQLMGEATTFINSKLWKILYNDIVYQAGKKMFIHSTNDFDLIGGKLALFNLDVLKTRLKSMEKGLGLFNKK